MKARSIFSSALASILLVSSGNAATISNFETRPHIVKIQSADQAEHVTILPSEKVNIDQYCQVKCIITLENTDTYEIEKNDNLILRDGGATIEPAK